MKITEALLAEHVVYHNLFDQIEQRAPRLKSLAEVIAVASLLDAMLMAHSQVEDELLIEPLDHCFEQLGQRDTFHQEHHDIEMSLKLAQASKTVRGARKLLLEAVLASRHHFDKEERLVFPMAEKILSGKSLVSLCKCWLEQRTAPWARTK